MRGNTSGCFVSLWEYNVNDDITLPFYARLICVSLLFSLSLYLFFKKKKFIRKMCIVVKLVLFLFQKGKLSIFINN